MEDLKQETTPSNDNFVSKLLTKIKNGYKSEDDNEAIDKVDQDSAQIKSAGTEESTKNIDLSLNTQINLLTKSSKLTDEEKKYIEGKTEALLKIEEEIMQIEHDNPKYDKFRKSYSNQIKHLMYRLHRNIIYLFLKKNIPENREILNNFIKLTNQKISLFNEILAGSLDSENPTNVAQSNDNVQDISENKGTNKVASVNIGPGPGKDPGKGPGKGKGKGEGKGRGRGKGKGKGRVK